MTEGVILSVASAKGGVGKTTSAINLGAATVLTTSKSILLVEADIGMANVLDFLDLPYDPETDPTLHDVLADEASIEESIVEADCGLAVLPSGDAIEGFQKARPQTLRPVLETARSRFDIIIVDTPAGVSMMTLLPLALSDGVLLVSNPRVSAIRDTQKTKSLVDRLEGNCVGLLLTMTGSGNAPPPDRLANFMEVPLIGSVSEDATVARAQDAGRPIIEYSPNAPAARGYLEAARTLGLITNSEEEPQTDVNLTK